MKQPQHVSGGEEFEKRVLERRLSSAVWLVHMLSDKARGFIFDEDRHTLAHLFVLAQLDTPGASDRDAVGASEGDPLGNPVGDTLGAREGEFAV